MGSMRISKKKLKIFHLQWLLKKNCGIPRVYFLICYVKSSTLSNKRKKVGTPIWRPRANRDKRAQIGPNGSVERQMGVLTYFYAHSIE